MRNALRLPIAPLVASFLAATALAAAPPTKTITLALKPPAKGQAPPVLDAAFSSAPFKLDVVDARTGLDAQIVGEQTEKSATVYVWRSDAPVGPAVSRFVADSLRAWSVGVDVAAPRSLSIQLEKYEVIEKSEQIGSFYKAAVTIAAKLVDADGRTLASGRGEGAAKKSGPDMRASMANEVLSNALRDALGKALAPGAPVEAPVAVPTIGTVVADPAAPPPVAATSDATKLLDELVKMKAAGVGEGVLVSYVKKQSLSAPLTAEEITRWKESGMSDAVIQAALDLR